MSPMPYEQITDTDSQPTFSGCSAAKLGSPLVRIAAMRKSGNARTARVKFTSIAPTRPAWRV
jgi:hypothetical protein